MLSKLKKVFSSENKKADEWKETDGMSDVGDYKVCFKEQISRGTFGSVFTAKHKATGEKVAGKQIYLMDGSRKNTDNERMAIKEFEILKSLRAHPNIVQLISYESTNDSFWMFLEFCDKGHLAEYLQTYPDMPVLRKLTIIGEVVSAIKFMHAQNPPIVHRDLKPQNILLKSESSEDVIKVTDFGLSKLKEEGNALSKKLGFGNLMQTTCGTSWYMAPELFAELESGTKYDESVDVFALGLIMKVVVEYSPNNREQLPLSVSSKGRPVVPYGCELVEKFKANEPEPSLFFNDHKVDRTIKRFQRIVVHMTAFQPKQRKNISEVDEEIAEMLEDIQERQLQVQAQTRTETMTEEQPQNQKGEPLKQTATCLSEEEQGLDLLSLTSSPLHEERRVRVQGTPYSLCVAHGRLYVCKDRAGLSEYSLQLERRGSLIDGTRLWWQICGTAEAESGALAVADVKGLYIVNMKGEVVQKLSELYHYDVCLGSDGRLYTVGWSSDRWQVHVYQQQRGGWVKTGQYNCPCTGDVCVFRITHMNNIIFLSCMKHNCIYKLKVDHNREEWDNLVGARELLVPCVTAADKQGSVIVVDSGNNRLVVLSTDGGCTELRTEPRLNIPMRAVITGSKLYVACFGDKSLRCFKLK